MTTRPLRGRRGLVRQIIAMVLDQDTRLVTLTGRSGIGKTSLAREVARQIRHERPDTQFAMVLLDAIETSDRIIDQMLLDLDVQPVDSDAVTAIADRLASRPAVLIVDNMEHVADGAGVLVELLDRCSDLTLVVTSQTRLDLDDEHVVRVPTLELPDPAVVEPDQLEIVPSVAVYCDRARAADHRFELTETNGPLIAELCRRLDGLPLAIGLVAARTATLPPSEILRQLDARPLSIVAGRRPSWPPRHRDMRAALDWTAGLLSDRERRLFARLSVVADSFDVETTIGLADLDGASSHDAARSPIADLESLVDFALVVRSDDGEFASFRLLPTVRAYAAEQLAAVGEGEAERTIRRHLALVADRMRVVGSAVERSGRLADASKYRNEVVHCLRLALERDDHLVACDLALGTAPIWQGTGFGDQERLLLEAVIGLCERAGRSDGAVGELLAWSVHLSVTHGLHLDDEIRSQRVAVAARLADEDDHPICGLRVAAASVFVAQAQFDASAAAAAAGDGVRLATELGDDRWAAAFSVWGGMVAHVAGDLEEAVALGRAGLRVARRVDDARTIVLATMLLRPLADQFPELADLLPSTAEIVELGRASGQAHIVRYLLPFAAAECVVAGDEDLASEYLESALASTGNERPNVPIFALVATQLFAASTGADEMSLNIAGAVAPLRDRIEPWMTPQFADRLLEAESAARSALGATRAAAAIACGESWTTEVALEVARSFVGTEYRKRMADRDATSVLTARQREVLVLVASGWTNAQIAADLGVSTKTVMHHVSGAYRATGVRSRSQATTWSIRNGLTDTISLSVN